MFSVKIIIHIKSQLAWFHRKLCEHNFFSKEPEVNWRRSLRGETQAHDSWLIVSVAYFAYQNNLFIYSGNVRDFRRWLAAIMQSTDISGGANGQKGKRIINRVARHIPPGFSHLAGKLPRCSTKSRVNLGDYGAHKSSRVWSLRFRV